MVEYGAADEISKLADLRERGLISEAEFEEQRGRILSGTRDRDKHRVPALAIIGASIATVALVIGLVVSTSSGPKKNGAGSSTVHLALASETSSDAATVSWAKSMINSSSGRSGAKYWYGCLAFAVDAWGIGADHSIRGEVTVPITSNTYPSDIWGHFNGGTTGNGSSPPAGALVFWNSKGGRDDSHVAISIGGGELVSTNVDQPSVPGYNGIHEESMAQFASNSWNIYDGWWLPDGTNAPPPADRGARSHFGGDKRPDDDAPEGDDGTERLGLGDREPPARCRWFERPTGGRWLERPTGVGRWIPRRRLGISCERLRVEHPGHHAGDHTGHDTGDEPTSAHDVLRDRRRGLAHLDGLRRRRRG